MDPQYCSGLDAQGIQCRCRRFIEQPGSYQCTCIHLEGYHPAEPAPIAPTTEPTAPVAPSSISPSDILATYYNPSQILTQKAGTPASTIFTPIASSSKIPPGPSTSSAAMSIAVQETSKGLKRKQPDDSGISGHVRKRAKTGLKKTAGSLMKIAAIIFVVTQAGDKTRQVFFTPKPPDIAHLETRGLAVNSLKSQLAINTAFTPAQVDTFLRGLFVSLFQYLDKHCALKAGEFHWKFLIKNNATLSVSPHSPADAAEITRYFGPTSRPQSRKIFFATNYAIPPEVWDHPNGQWNHEVPPEDDVEMDEVSEEEGEDILSVGDSEESWVNPDDSPPKKKSKKAQGKQRAVEPTSHSSASESPVISISDSESEEGEFSPPFTQATTSALPALDARPARPIRTTRSISTLPRTAPYSAYAYCSAKNFVPWDEEDLPLDDQFWNASS
ncbi:hypothetical protein R3P38DRAFT_2810095 [Favolaschia claudopus]|uniref:Uncharacterized protein n=1 Tax=Favolaschia claudopus TaxID=2862362 RepID=A0AAV9ZCF9_9AGAR